MPKPKSDFTVMFNPISNQPARHGKLTQHKFTRRQVFMAIVGELLMAVGFALVIALYITFVFTLLKSI